MDYLPANLISETAQVNSFNEISTILFRLCNLSHLPGVSIANLLFYLVVKDTIIQDAKTSVPLSFSKSLNYTHPGAILLLTLLSHLFLELHISRSQISTQGLLEILTVCTRESNCFISMAYSFKALINSKWLISVLLVHSYPAFDFLSTSDKGITEMTHRSGDSDSPSNFPLFVLTLPILFPLRFSFVFYSLVIGF